MSDMEVRPCEQCNASIYREHLETGIAGYARGKLLCTHCLAEATGESPKLAASAVKAGAFGGGDSVALTADPLASTSRSGSSVRTAIHEHGPEHGIKESTKLRRPLLGHGDGATRCRTFHAKLNEGAIAFMNDLVNEWVDSHPDVTIKFATSTIGVFEGKHAEPNLVVTVFY